MFPSFWHLLSLSFIVTVVVKLVYRLYAQRQLVGHQHHHHNQPNNLQHQLVQLEPNQLLEQEREDRLHEDEIVEPELSLTIELENTLLNDDDDDLLYDESAGGDQSASYESLHNNNLRNLVPRPTYFQTHHLNLEPFGIRSLDDSDFGSDTDDESAAEAAAHEINGTGNVNVDKLEPLDDDEASEVGSELFEETFADYHCSTNLIGATQLTATSGTASSIIDLPEQFLINHEQQDGVQVPIEQESDHDDQKQSSSTRRTTTTTSQSSESLDHQQTTTLNNTRRQQNNQSSAQQQQPEIEKHQRTATADYVIFSPSAAFLLSEAFFWPAQCLVKLLTHSATCFVALLDFVEGIEKEPTGDSLNKRSQLGSASSTSNQRLVLQQKQQQTIINNSSSRNQQLPNSNYFLRRYKSRLSLSEAFCQ